MLLDNVTSLAASGPDLWWLMLLPVGLLVVGLGLLAILLRFLVLARRHGVHWVRGRRRNRLSDSGPSSADFFDVTGLGGP